ncbi:stage II sporulation protein GA (sporulation sigma-E factor processing peptidase) [Bacillus sp. cl95]|nr:stage II sporulation protein GA (sporulation sigma-E factor processing peptidase) [Bacillus sp. UNCCL13]SFQ65443.1 stage II sporulation protein GA (sporulation sigma-E factor processing peptidase) [Bacillus sp. cl95]
MKSFLRSRGAVKMTVYVDVIWALNFLFDSLLLYLTAIILKREFRLWRLLLGGFIGSLIIILSFTPLNSFSGHPIIKLLFSILMVFSVFGYKRLRYFISGLFTLYLATFLVGGFLIGMHYFIRFDNELTTNVLISSVKGYGDPVSWLFVMIGFPVAWHFSKSRIESIEMTKIEFDQKVDVLIRLGERTYSFRGLVDSGNQLYDPFSRMPVMFVSLFDRLDLFPEAIKKMAEDPECLINGNDEVHSEWQSKLKIIPCRSVGQEHQLIIAIKPDQVFIVKDQFQIDCSKCLVSFTMQRLSADDSFQCIVHPKMLTGVRKPVASTKVS